MTSVVEQTDDPGKVEPPAKRRRGGRRSSNPDISAEERKRLRVLKNRESAMRSLAKKAEYSAKLVTMEKEVIAEYKSSRESLEKLICNAVTLRDALGKVPENVEKLIADADACINRGTSALAQDDEDFEATMSAAPQESDDLPDQSASGDSAEG